MIFQPPLTGPTRASSWYMHIIIKDGAGRMAIEGYVRSNGDTWRVCRHQEALIPDMFDGRIRIGARCQPDVVRHVSHGCIDFSAVNYPA